MPFVHRTGYKCLVFLLMVLLLSLRAFSDDLKNKAEENPLNCAHYLITKSFAEQDSLGGAAGFLSIAYWNLGRRSEALQELELIEYSQNRFDLLMRFADASVKENRRDEAANLFRKAFETVRSDFSEYEMRTAEKMATQLMSLGKELDALDIANFIKDTGKQANALTAVACEYLRQGKNDKAIELLDEALSAVKASDEQELKALVMAKIGAAYAIAGKRAEAKEILLQAVEIGKSSSSDNILSPETAYYIANGYMTLGAEEHIFELFEKPDGGKEFLARHYLKRGEKEKAKKMLSEIETQYKKDCENVALVDWYLRFEDYESAVQAIQINNCFDSGSKLHAALDIARASIGKRPHQEIADVLTFALQEALALSNYEPEDTTYLSTSNAMERVIELAAVADVMMDAGCFDLAYLAVNAIEKPNYKAQKLSDLAGRQIKSLPKQKVLEMLGQSWQMARKPTDIPLDMWREKVLIAIACRYAEAGEKAKAADLFAQILESARVDAGKGSDSQLVSYMITIGEQLERHKVPVNVSLRKTMHKIIKDWQDD